MLHFPSLKATKEELANPSEYWKGLQKRVGQACQDLTDPSKYQVKIIDYGFSKVLDEGTVLQTPVGVLHTKAPETEYDAKMKYDERIDIWSIGVFYFILLSGRMMFAEKVTSKGITKYRKNEWYLEVDDAPHRNLMNVTLGALKFIDDTVRHDFNERPVA